MFCSLFILLVVSFLNPCIVSSVVHHFHFRHLSIYLSDCCFCAHACVFRRWRKEARVHRNAALETAAMTAGTLRGVSLSLHHDTLVTTLLTGERNLSALTQSHTHTHTHTEVFQIHDEDWNAAVLYILVTQFQTSKLIPLIQNLCLH